MNDLQGPKMEIFGQPKFSNWTCYMFGATKGNGFSYTPIEGNVPNIIVRWFMKLCFACTWVKDEG